MRLCEKSLDAAAEIELHDLWMELPIYRVLHQDMCSFGLKVQCAFIKMKGTRSLARLQG
jgi:hypothetical protein